MTPGSHLHGSEDVKQPFNLPTCSDGRESRWRGMRTSAMSALWEVALQVGQGNCGIFVEPGRFESNRSHRNVHCHKVEAAGKRGRRRGQCWSSHHNLVPVLSPLPILMVSGALSRNFSIYVLPIPIPGVPCVCDRKGFICGRSHLVWGLP